MWPFKTPILYFIYNVIFPQQGYVALKNSYTMLYYLVYSRQIP